MGNNTHKLEIFRGFLKFKSNQTKIWGVLIFLSIVTIIEVALGILKPEVLIENYFFKNEIDQLDLHYINYCQSLLHYVGFYAFKR